MLNLNNKQIKNIVILGGGTAGWVTALNFLQKTNDINITVISSKEVPIIGVGESTTGIMNGLININNGKVKINELDFIKKTDSTFKLGIVHKDWYKIGESFVSPLGDEFKNETNYPHSSYDYGRIYHVAKGLKNDHYTPSKLMLTNKLPYLHLKEKNPYINFDKEIKIDFKLNHVAYHLDAFKVGQYLKNFLIKNGQVNHIEDKIIYIDKDKQGFVKNLKTEQGINVKGDLFIDCSGFFRLLIKDNNEFISYENNLLTNRAIAFPTTDYKISNHTVAKARKYGWEWNIPLQSRMGRGYVFNDTMISVDQAVEELEKDYGKIDIVNDIKFTVGRMKNIWHKNVLSTGLASGFLEPLEATSIHMTILQVNIFIEQYFTKELNFNCEPLINQYNLEIQTIWDDLRDFINLHYISPRKDTDFWIESSSEKRYSENLKNKLEIWKHRMPRINDYQGGLYNKFYQLGNTLWYQILIGMNLLDKKIAEKELNDFRLMQYAEDRHYKKINIAKWIIDNSIDSEKLYSDINYYFNNYEKLNFFEKG